MLALLVPGLLMGAGGGSSTASSVVFVAVGIGSLGRTEVGSAERVGRAYVGSADRVGQKVIGTGA